MKLEIFKETRTGIDFGKFIYAVYCNGEFDTNIIGWDNTKYYINNKYNTHLSSYKKLKPVRCNFQLLKATLKI